MIKATFYRLEKAVSVKVCIGIACVAAVLYFILSYQIATGNIGVENAGSVTGLCDSLIIWLTGSLITGIIFCGDFSSKSVHCAVARKNGRRNLILGYSIVFVIMILLLVLPYTLTSLVSMIIGADFTGAEPAMTSIYLNNQLYDLGELSIVKLLYLYLANAFVYVGSISICFPVAIKVKKPVVVTAFGFMFGMLTALLALAAEKLDLLGRIMKLTPFTYGLGNLNLESSYGEITLALFISVIFTMLMGGLTYLLFRREEIK